MGLLAPWFLAGLGLLAMPVWLHLLKRHRSVPLHFSSLMFFERSQSSRVRQRKLDYLLLLALRLALIALGVFAFSRPFLTSTAAGGEGDRLVVLALDESASMASGDRMERATTAAMEVAGRLSAKTEARVVAFSSRTRLLTPATREKPELMAGIRSVRAGSLRSSLADLAASLRNLAQTAKKPLEVHLFSDLQRSSMPSSFQELRLNPGTKLILHRVADSIEPNWTVEGVLSSRRVADLKRERVEAVLAGYNTPAARKRVELVVGGQVKASQEVEIPASGKTKVTFVGLDVPYGFTRCAVRIAGGDSLQADDARFFAVERADPERIFFSGAGLSALYVRNALEATAPGMFALEERAPGLDWKSYSAVLLADPGALPRPVEDSLTSFVKAGGGLMIAAGAATAAAGKVPVAGLKISGTSYQGRQGDRFQSLVEADMAHPALAGTGRWDLVRFYQTPDIEPGQSLIAARLSGGLPLLLESRIGEGRVWILAGAIDGRASDLPLHPAFLPFIEKSLRWLSGSEERASAALAGSSLELRRTRGGEASVEVTGPRGVRLLSLAEAATTPSISLDEAGFWEIRRTGGRTELVAANIDPRESDLALMPADSAELWQGAPMNAPQTEKQAAVETRVQFWPWLVALCLAALLVEIWLAGRYLDKEAA